MADMLQPRGFFPQRQRLKDGLLQRGLGARDEFDARGLGCVLAGIDHRILKTARGPDDGDGSVAQRVQLMEAARLEARGHQVKIRPRFDAVRQGRIEADPGGHLIRESFGQIPEGILQGPLATAQEGELQRFAGVEQASQGLDNQRRALLVGQARNVGEEREGGVFWETQFALQRRLANGLARRVLRRERHRQRRVGAGAPLFVVHSIEYATQVVVALEQQSLEATTVLRSQDFLRVGRADCGDGLRLGETRFQEIHPLIVQRAFQVQPVGGQSGETPTGCRERPLESQVVDGEDRPRRLGPPGLQLRMPGQDRDQPRLPIVAMQDLWGLWQMAG